MQADFEVRGTQAWLSDNGRHKSVSLYEERKEESWKHPVTGYSLTYRRLRERVYSFPNPLLCVICECVVAGFSLGWFARGGFTHVENQLLYVNTLKLAKGALARRAHLGDYLRHQRRAKRGASL